jgi:hypothetical protein
MVVIIEDVTDQHENQTVENEETKEDVGESANPEADHDLSEKSNDSGSWVEVNNKSSSNGRDNLEDDQNVAEEEAVDPEVFAVRIERFVKSIKQIMNICTCWSCPKLAIV